MKDTFIMNSDTDWMEHWESFLEAGSNQESFLRSPELEDLDHLEGVCGRGWRKCLLVTQPGSIWTSLSPEDTSLGSLEHLELSWCGAEEGSGLCVCVCLKEIETERRERHRHRHRQRETGC